MPRRWVRARCCSTRTTDWRDPAINYAAELFQEGQVRSVVANTRADGEQFLALAARFAITSTTVAYPMQDAPRALADLAHGRFGGAAALHN